MAHNQILTATRTGVDAPGAVTILEFQLPKISLNEWYAGSHWSNRTKIKDTYKVLIASVTKHKFSQPCTVEYHFTFKSRPLDCSNAVAMLKMIEDCLFPDDGYKIVQGLNITSRKAKTESVTIKITNK